MKKVLLYAVIMSSCCFGASRNQDFAVISLIRSINLGSLRDVEQSLDKGVLINATMGVKGETPLMFAIRAFAEAAEKSATLRDGAAEIGKGAAIIGTSVAVGVAGGNMWDTIDESIKAISPNSIFRHACPVSFTIAVVVGSLYGGAKIAKGLGKTMVIIPYEYLMLSRRFKIVEKIAGYPSIEPSVHNSQGKAAQDILHEYMLKNAENTKVFRLLKSVEDMLEEKQRQPRELQHEEDGMVNKVINNADSEE